MPAGASAHGALHDCMQAFLHVLRFVCLPHLQEKLLFSTMREAEFAASLFTKLFEDCFRHPDLQGPKWDLVIIARIGLDHIWCRIRLWRSALAAFQL